MTRSLAYTKLTPVLEIVQKKLLRLGAAVYSSSDIPIHDPIGIYTVLDNIIVNLQLKHGTSFGCIRKTALVSRNFYVLVLDEQRLGSNN